MRVTNRMMTENAVKYMTDSLEELNRLSNQVSSGKQFQSPSDNPAAASAALSMRSTLNITSAYQTTAQNADDWVGSTEAALKQMSTIGARAVDLVKQGLTDTLSDSERNAALGTELAALVENAITVANSSHQGSYLFAGFKVRLAVQPFTLSGSTVSNTGDQGAIKREVGPNQDITVNINGETEIKPLLQALVVARDALTADPTDPAAIRAALDGVAGVGGLNNAMEELIEARTTNGARQRQIRATLERLEKTQTELKSLLSQKEDVNLAEAISMMRAQETNYKAVLEVGQRTISALNLFDYLR